VIELDRRVGEPVDIMDLTIAMVARWGSGTGPRRPRSCRTAEIVKDFVSDMLMIARILFLFLPAFKQRERPYLWSALDCVGGSAWFGTGKPTGAVWCATSLRPWGCNAGGTVMKVPAFLGRLIQRCQSSRLLSVAPGTAGYGHEFHQILVIVFSMLRLPLD